MYCTLLNIVFVVAALVGLVGGQASLSSIQITVEPISTSLGPSR